MRILPILLAVFFVTLQAASAQVPALTGGAAAPASADAQADDPADNLSIEALIDILEDDAARVQLIDSLRETLKEDAAPAATAAAAGTTGGKTEDAEQEAGALATSMVRTVAEQTRALAEKAMLVVQSFDKMTGDIGDAIAELRQVNLSQFSFVLTQLGLAIGVVFGSFLVLRRLAELAIAAFARRAARTGTWTSRLSLLVPTAVVDLLAVLIAWMAGYAFSLVFGNAGHMSIHQTLFLNAFLIIEASKVVLRLLLMYRHAPLRVVPLDDTDAAYWYFWLSRIVSLVGYGVLFAVPVINSEISFRVGTAVQEIVVFFALLLCLVLVLQNRSRVRTALHRRLDAGRSDLLGRFFLILGNQWHRILIFYLVAFFVVWMTDPGNAVAFMTQATLRSLAAIVVGVVVTVLTSRVIRLGLRLPGEVKQSLPLLEDRLNAFVPTVLKGVRIVVLVGVILAIADAWNLMDVAGWVFSNEGQGFFGVVGSVLVILAIGGAFYLAVASWVEYRLNPEVGAAPTARETTLLSLLRSAFTILLCIVLAMMVLSEIGVNIGPLIAGAGVFGLAISFGAQKFVQDVITGIFIQFDNAMNTGDVVTAGGISGVVEKLTIRSVSIRSADGTLHFIPFSSVDAVSNFMKHFSFHVAEIGVAYRENIAEVKLAMQEAFDRLRAVDDHAAVILDDLEMHGVTALADSAVMVRARIKTVPGSQWGIGRAYNELIKEVFDERGIEIPYPHLTLYMGEDKNGNAPPMRILREPAGRRRPGGQPPQPEETDGQLAAQRKGEITPENQDGPGTDEG